MLVEQCAGSFAETPAGGAGGGVQFLDVMEARARTFEHLFVLGLNRGVFPRVVQEDALLPEHLRARLKSVLPDIPMKGKGYEEEPYLFAQLLASAPHITLSWKTLDASGKSATPSAFIDALLIDKPELEVQESRSLMSGQPSDDPTERNIIPAFDYALNHALLERRDGLAPRSPAIYFSLFISSVVRDVLTCLFLATIKFLNSLNGKVR